MTSPNPINRTPYLRTAREYPREVENLSHELNKTYVDIASAVNERTIGLFPTIRPAVTGNSYFLEKNQRQQSLRQVYPFTSDGGTITIAHGINLSNISYVPVITGTFMDSSTNVFYPLPYVDVINANNQINVKITQTDIVITPEGGSPPNLSVGLVLIEWLSQP